MKNRLYTSYGSLENAAKAGYKKNNKFVNINVIEMPGSNHAKKNHPCSQCFLWMINFLNSAAFAGAYLVTCMSLTCKIACDSKISFLC
jgi:hypothetical protein